MATREELAFLAQQLDALSGQLQTEADREQRARFAQMEDERARASLGLQARELQQRADSETGMRLLQTFQKTYDYAKANNPSLTLGEFMERYKREAPEEWGLLNRYMPMDLAVLRAVQEEPAEEPADDISAIRSVSGPVDRDVLDLSAALLSSPYGGAGFGSLAGRKLGEALRTGFLKEMNESLKKAGY